MAGGINMEVVAKVQLGEGPHWVESEQSLYFVDLLDGSLHRFDATNKKCTATKPAGGRTLTFTVPVSGRRGMHVVGHGRDFSVLQWDGVSSTNQKKRVLVTVEDDIQNIGETRLNDGKADPSGKLWAGTMSMGLDSSAPFLRLGNLYSLEDGGTRAQMRVKDVDVSNGLCWSNDVFYYIDSFTKKVEAFDFDISSGNISNRRTVFDYLKNNIEGIPDGMTIDTSGKLWVACFGSSQVLCIDSVTARLVTQVKMPVLQITSVAWGGRSLDELYVTTAGIRDQLNKPNAGSVYRVTGLGARGLPADEVKLGPAVLSHLT